MQKSTARPPLGIAFSIVAVVSVFLALLYVHLHEAELLWVWGLTALVPHYFTLVALGFFTVSLVYLAREARIALNELDHYS